jgi:hypothetical protein
MIKGLKVKLFEGISEFKLVIRGWSNSVPLRVYNHKDSADNMYRVHRRHYHLMWIGDGGVQFSRTYSGSYYPRMFGFDYDEHHHSLIIDGVDGADG